MENHGYGRLLAIVLMTIVAAMLLGWTWSAHE